MKLEVKQKRVSLSANSHGRFVSVYIFCSSTNARIGVFERPSGRVDSGIFLELFTFKFIFTQVQNNICQIQINLCQIKINQCQIQINLYQIILNQIQIYLCQIQINLSQIQIIPR